MFQKRMHCIYATLSLKSLCSRSHTLLNNAMRSDNVSLAVPSPCERRRVHSHKADGAADTPGSGGRPVAPGLETWTACGSRK